MVYVAGGETPRRHGDPETSQIDGKIPNRALDSRPDVHGMIPELLPGQKGGVTR